MANVVKEVQKGSFSGLDWAASMEVPIYVPNTPRDLLTTPLTSPKSKFETIGMADCYKKIPGDQSFHELQLLLTEHRKEVNRVATEYEQRIAAVFQSQFLAVSSIMSSGTRTWESRSVVVDCGVQASEEVNLDSLDNDHLLESVADVVEKERSSVHDSAREVLGIDTTRQGVDFSMVRGWVKKVDGSRYRSKLQHIVEANMTVSNDPSDLQQMFGSIVQRPAFDIISTTVIVLHALIMGVAADHAIHHVGQGHPQFYALADLMFLIFYIIELILRMCAKRWQFFFSSWDVADLFVVTCDAAGQVQEKIFHGSSNALDDVATARTFRVLRLMRIFRVLRLISFFRELRLMVKCMLIGVKTVIWAMVLLSLFIFVFAVYLVEQVASGLNDHGSKHEEDLMFFFGHMIKAGLSLFMAITGGVSWIEISTPLIELHPTNGVVFVVFICFSVFVMLNIISGVFVECTMSAARSDQDEVLQAIIENEKSELNKIRKFFQEANVDGDEALSFEELTTQLEKPETRILFKSFGLSVHEVVGLFRLLDMDNSGSITLEEFLTGCLRLREGASAVDMCTLLYENKRMVEKWSLYMAYTEKQFKLLHDHLSKLHGEPSSRRSTL